MAEAWLTEKPGKQTELVHKAERIVPASVPHGQSAIGFSSSQEVQGWIWGSGVRPGNRDAHQTPPVTAGTSNGAYGTTTTTEL